jgi:chemotaxis protein MotA
MFAIIGILVVIGAVVGGYLMEHGQILVLMQPAELAIIGGCAIGALLVANPVHVLKSLVADGLAVLKPSPYSRGVYFETLKMLYALFNAGRRGGDQALEGEIEAPENGPSFALYPAFVKDKAATAYVCDTLRMSLMGGSPHDLEALMELDAETQEHERAESVSALQTMADALPGFGIVAAVLGVVITMGALGGAPDEIGHKVAAALVGTFLGILLSYGVVGPLAALIHKQNDARTQYMACLRSAVIAYAKGSSAIMSVEFGRRSVPVRCRPAFNELEEACRNGGSSAPAEELEAEAA